MRKRAGKRKKTTLCCLKQKQVKKAQRGDKKGLTLLLVEQRHDKMRESQGFVFDQNERRLFLLKAMLREKVEWTRKMLLMETGKGF